MPSRTRPSLALLLTALVPAQASAECTLSGVLAPHRRTGTAEVKLTGSRSAQGRFPAVCGAYFLLDAPPMGKAGDGMVFETCVPGVGKLQVTGSGKRTAGPVRDFGLVLHTDTRSLLGSGGAPDQLVLGADLFSATVKATARTLGRARPGKPSEEVRLAVSFSCPR